MWLLVQQVIQRMKQREANLLTQQQKLWALIFYASEHLI